MFLPGLTLGLLGLASASTIAAREPNDYPTSSTSKGFKLVVNVTDPSKDFDPPVHNSFVTGIHVGAGLADLGTSPKYGRIFYQNGTADEYNDAKSNVLTDEGEPPAPAGIELAPAGDGTYNGTLNVGPGTPGIRLSATTPTIFLLPETFFACNESIPYYPGRYFILIRQNIDANKVPSECTPVRLIPECAELEELPDNAIASHAFAIDSPCYDNVTEFHWN